MSSIRCALPLCQRGGEQKLATKQTNYSIGLRVTAIALGVILALTGILSLLGVGVFASLGTLSGSFSLSSGALLVLVGVCVKCVASPPSQKQTTPSSPVKSVKPSKVEPSEDTSESEVEKGAILYMSITGNPPHFGHLAAMGTAIKELKKRKITVVKGYVSLSNQLYLESKMKTTAGKVYSFVQRKDMISHLLKEAQSLNMFDGVSVEFWNDQSEGFSDHPDSYRTLAEREKEHKVYLVAGSDLCRRMGNWGSVAHAVVVTRGGGDPETVATYSEDKTYIVSLRRKDLKVPYVKDQDTGRRSRILVANAFPEYKDYSSTKIRKGELKVNYLPGD